MTNKGTMNGVGMTPRMSVAGDPIDRTTMYNSRTSIPTDTRRNTVNNQGSTGGVYSPQDGRTNVGPGSFGQRLVMTDLKNKLEETGKKLREEIQSLTVRDKAPRNDLIDLMSAGKERRNDIALTDEKALEKIVSDEKSKETGSITCMECCSKKETFVAGTKKMHVLCYNFKQNWFKLVKIKAKGPITCIDLSKSSEYVICGTEGGGLFLLRIKDNMVENLMKIDGFTKENIRDVKFTEVGLSIAVLDDNQTLFHLNANMTKSKPTYDAQIIQNNTRSAKLSHLKVLSIPRLDGAESKVKVLFAGGFNQSLLFRLHKGSYIQIDSLETVPIEAKAQKSSIIGDISDENYQSFCVEDYDTLPWISESEIKLLYVVRGSMIYIRFAHMTNSDELIINSFSEFRFSDSIIFASLICPGVMCVIDQFNQIKFINMRKIIKSQHETKDVDFTSANYVSLKSVTLKDEQLLFSDQPYGRNNKNYMPYITAGRKGRYMLIATSKRLVNFELLDWKTYVSNLENDEDHLGAIQLLIEISEGEYYKLYGVSPAIDRRRAAMVEFIEGFVSRLNKSNVVETSTSPSAMIRILASLLVKTGNIDYLFNTFYEAMGKINQDGELLRIIEDYIRSGQLGKFGPESLGGAIMEVFPAELKKKLLLECFNKSEKRGQVINLTIHNRFYDLLFYMCPKHDAISCLFPISLCINEININGEEDADKEAKVDQQTLLRMLWYCETLMRGELMFKEKADPELIKQIPITIIKWIIDPGNAKLICKANFLYYLDTLLLGLNQMNMIAFQEHEYSDSPVRKSSASDFKILSESSFKEFDKLFYEIKQECSKIQSNYFNLFLALLMVEGLPKIKLQGHTIEVVMSHLITNFDFLVKDIRIKLPEDEIQSVVFDIFTTNSAILKNSKDFTDAAEKCQNVFKVMMLENNDKYEETFMVYIKLIKDKISHAPLFFQWLKRVFTDPTLKKATEVLHKPLVDNFNYLNEVGKTEIMNIWDHFELQLKMDTAISLNKLGQSQLTFLRKLMRLADNKEAKIRIPDKIKLLFFERLCEFSPEEVLQELKKNHWPTLECLEICLKYNVELGVAYINERLGKYMDALDIFVSRFARFANEFKASMAGKKDRSFYEEVFKDDMSDANLFKIHHNCTTVAKEYLDKLEEDHMMFKGLAKMSDNKLEVGIELKYRSATSGLACS